MQRLSQAYGRALDALMFLACLLLLLMTLLIGTDVISRNLGLGGMAWSAEASEDALYLVTLLAAPWLLRQGQHIRVDILLRALPPRIGWLLEWVGDLLGLACSLYFVWYGWKVLAASYQAGAITIKTLVTPEWWMLAPLPVAFALFAVEFVFRMHRLSRAERAPRTDAVSAS
jgi:TRAP-type C4-dicarboxylate transport system permease small subunit